MLLVAVVVVFGIAVFSYPGGLASANGTTRWLPFLFWIAVLICLMIVGFLSRA